MSQSRPDLICSCDTLADARISTATRWIQALRGNSLGRVGQETRGACPWPVREDRFERRLVHAMLPLLGRTLQRAIAAQRCLLRGVYPSRLRRRWWNFARLFLM